MGTTVFKRPVTMQDVNGKVDGPVTGADILTNVITGATNVDGALTALNSGKTDKVSSATSGNFAGLDSNGNLTDSGKKASDFATPSDIPAVVNNLTSDSTTDALSAAQGKALNTSVLNIDTATYREMYGTGEINNCNDAEIGRLYFVYGSTTNSPKQGILFTYGKSNTKYQLFFSENRTFTRAYMNSSWTSWEEFAMDNKYDPSATSLYTGDLNSISGTSCVYCNTSATHKPDNQTWGICYSWKFDANTMFQMFIANAGTRAGCVYTRTKDSGTWGSWNEYERPSEVVTLETSKLTSLYANSEKNNGWVLSFIGTDANSKAVRVGFDYASGIYCYYGGSKQWQVNPQTISSLSANITNVSNKIAGIEQSGVGNSIFNIRFRNDANNHQMAIYFSSNPTSDGFKIRLYDATDNWSIIWSIT